MEKLLVTGCSGFIGMHLCLSLLKREFHIIGIDNLDSYYSVDLKKVRLKQLLIFNNFKFINLNISDKVALREVFKKFHPEKVINLAAQPSVQYSIENPDKYINSNIVGFMNILEECRHSEVLGLIYASSSSVYGDINDSLLSESNNNCNPISIYGVTKRSNELMASTYSNLFNLPQQN